MKIVLSAVLALVLLGCGEENNSEATKVEHKTTPQEVVKEAVAQHVAKVTSKKEEVKKEVVQKVVEPVKEAVKEVAKVDGKTIFKACIGCHGASADKPALGKSKIIKGWDADKIEAALNGYQDGTYGGAMKGLMKAQSSKLSAEDKKAVSEYISKL